MAKNNSQKWHKVTCPRCHLVYSVAETKPKHKTHPAIAFAGVLLIILAVVAAIGALAFIANLIA